MYATFRFVSLTLLLTPTLAQPNLLLELSPIRFEQCCQFDCVIWDYLFSSGSRSFYDDNNDDDDDVTIGFFFIVFFFEAVRFCSIRFGFYSAVSVCVWFCVYCLWWIFRFYVFVSENTRVVFCFLRIACAPMFMNFSLLILLFLRCLVLRLAFIVFENIQSQLFAFF